MRLAQSAKRTTEKYSHHLPSRPLRGLETLKQTGPSAEAPGYFQPSASRTTNHASFGVQDSLCKATDHESSDHAQSREQSNHFFSGVLFSHVFPPSAVLFSNGPTAAYYPQAQFISSRGYSFLLDQFQPAWFRLDSDRAHAWSVEGAEVVHQAAILRELRGDGPEA